METKTVEGKGSTRNGILRMVIVVISLLLEAGFIIVIFTQLNEYAEFINIITRVVGLLLVLRIYAEHKTAAMKLPWIMLILILPIFGVILYLVIGLNPSTRKMKERYKAVDDELFPLLVQDESALSEVEQTDPEAAGIMKYLRNNAGYPCYNDSEVTYFDDALDGLKSQLAEMAKAEHFIFMEYFAIEDKEAWKQIQDVLVERVKAGVEVRVFYDDAGSIGYINMSFAKKLRELGIDCRVFNPFIPGLNMFLNNRDHRKLTVIDNKVGYTGGYNLANEYFNYTHPFGQWKDTGIKITGSAVQSLTVTFLEMWNAIKESDKKQGFTKDTDYQQYLRTDGLEKPKTTETNGTVQPYGVSPMEELHVGEDVYISMLNKANDYCYFITPYLIISDELTSAMCLAAMRGVDVRIITPGIPDKKLIYSITRSFYSALVKKGVRIYEWTPGFCHAKMSVVDGKMATCGTINLDYRSLYHHFEFGCFMHDCKAVTDIKKDFDKTLLQCTEVTEKYSQGRSAALRLGQLFLRLFAELL